MNINRFSSSATVFPINRGVFSGVDQQKKFVMHVFLISFLLIAGVWIWDIICFVNSTLVMDTAFWVRQGAALFVLIHMLLMQWRHYSFILFNLAVILNLSIMYLVFFSSYFPSQYFILLTIIPTTFISIFYERKFSQWFLIGTCCLVLAGFYLILEDNQIWNAGLIMALLLIVSLVIYLQNPSIQFLRKINEVQESQYVNMLKLVYDGVAICQENKILDADEDFYSLFQIPLEKQSTLELTDILTPEAKPYVNASFHDQQTAVVNTLGQKNDGTIIPIVLYMVCQTINQKSYHIVTVHDSSAQLMADYLLQQKNTTLSMINRISQMVNSSLSLGDVLSIILEETQRIYKNRSSSLWLLEEGTKEFTCVNAKGTHAASQIGVCSDMDDEIIRQLWRVQEPLFIEDINQHPDKDKILRGQIGFEPRSLLILPILFQDRLIGMMQLLDDRVNVLDKEDINVLQSIAANSAIAINNARQFERLAEDQQRWKTLHVISQRINACLQPKDIISAITENIRDILPFDYFIIGRVEPQIPGCEIMHLIGKNQDRLDYHVDKVTGLIGYVLENGRPVLIDDYGETHREKMDLLYINEENHKVKSVLAIPMIRGGRTIGILSVQSFEVAKYHPVDLQMLELIAAHIVIAFDNARHYQEALESARLRDMIYLVGQEINARLKPDQVYETIFRAVEKLIPMDLMYITLADYEKETHGFCYFRDIPMNKNRDPFTIPIEQGVAGYVVRTGKSFRSGEFLFEEISHKNGNLKFGEEDLVHGSVIAVPMMRDQIVTGVLSVQAKAPHQFTAYHETVLELIAPYAASALENAWLFSKIEALAITDELSGVYNRHYFNHTLQMEVECSQRYQRPLSLLIIDIDNFKDINDKYGHICGDEIVRQFGSMLKINVRTSDILARFGGDEFAVIMPETNSEKALLAAQKYAKICNECIFTFGQENIQITISIGLAEMMHQEDLKPEELIHKADHAMYQAKNCGRNQIVVYKG